MGFKLSVVAIFAMIAVAYAQNAASEQGGMNSIARSSQLFAARVYQELKNKEGNILVCPVSVQTVLALVQAGAQGDTASEIQRALFLPAEKSAVQNGYKQLMSQLNSAEGVHMDIANIVYVKDGYTINPNFQQIAKNSFYSAIENIDFSKNDVAAKKINQWVEQKTNNRIKDLISPADLDHLTRMVLVNALYFKGTWLNEFNKYNTRDQDFWLSASRSIKVPMMSTTSNFKYAENKELNCKFLEMPYSGNEYAMTIVLPNEKDGLPALENRIAEVLQPQNYKNERVEVIMPLFSTEETIDFTPMLQNMGMTKSFGGEADFSGLLENKEDLFISKVIQKNFINVTEAGTEAASATAVELELRMGEIPANVDLTVDHPFLYMIQEMKTSTIIFIGRTDSFNSDSDANQDTQQNNTIISTRANVAKSAAACSTFYLQTIAFVVLVKLIHFIF